MTLCVAPPTPRSETFCLSPDAVADACGDWNGFRTLIPRSYQTELRDYAVSSGNSIIYAPYRSGKSLVAALVAEYCLERWESPEDYRILFVVDEVSLIDQKKE